MVRCQALDLAHRLRMPPLVGRGSTPERLDAEADQPDRKPGELYRTVLLPPKLQGRGIAVVGDYRIGQAVGLEHPRQPLADGGLALVPASRAPSRQRE